MRRSHGIHVSYSNGFELNNMLDSFSYPSFYPCRDFLRLQRIVSLHLYHVAIILVGTECKTLVQSERLCITNGLHYS